MMNRKGFYEKTDAIVKKYMDQNRAILKDDTVLYHYTTQNGLKNIIESNSFHFTHYAYLNDPSECRYTFEVVERVLYKFKSENKIDEKVFTNLHKCLLKDKVENSDAFECPHYILSFSGSEDNLSMWRAYADDGLGVTIGIKPLKVDEESETELSYWRNLVKVIYGNNKENKKEAKNEQEILIENILNDMITIFNINNLDSMDLALLFFLVLYPFRAVGKHKGYEEENEYRYICSPFNSSVETKTNSKGNLVPYFSTNGEKMFEEGTSKKIGDNGKEIKLLPISEIGIGPRLDQNKTENAIKIMLENKGYDLKNIEFYKSDIPYSG